MAEGGIASSGGESSTLIYLRSILAPWVQSGMPFVSRFQSACGVVPGKGWSNPLLHCVFTLGAALGNELFFITFLPALFWELDLLVARRTIYAWLSAYIIGQWSKDSLKLPRPGRSVATVLETHYEHEYGMPSTHAMNAVLMPWYIVYLSWSRFTGSLPLLLTLAAAWSTATILSRFYMGVHCPADVVVGSALGLLVLLTHMAIGPSLDAIILTSHTTVYALGPLALAALVWAYPRPSSPGWVNSPGDTVLIAASCLGVAMAVHATAHAHAPVEQFSFSGPTVEDALPLAKRVALGVAIMLTTRAVAKEVALAVIKRCFGPVYTDGRDPSLLPNAHPVDVPAEVEALNAIKSVKRAHITLAYEGAEDPSNPGDATPAPTSNQSGGEAPTLIEVPPSRRYEIELPTKCVTYTAVGFVAVYVVPHTFQYLGWKDYRL